MKRTYLSLLLGAICLQACAQTPNNDLLADILPDKNEVSFELINGSLRNPWGMAFLPNGDLLVTEKTGQIKRLRGKQLIDESVKGGPESKTQGQGGLMDIKLHPDFGTNQWVYFTYASAEGQGDGAMTALSRATWNGEGFVDYKVLYKGAPNTRAGQHY